MALPQSCSAVEQSSSELSVAVQVKQNSPASKVTVREVSEKELPPLVPLHA